MASLDALLHFVLQRMCFVIAGEGKMNFKAEVLQVGVQLQSSPGRGAGLRLGWSHPLQNS